MIRFMSDAYSLYETASRIAAVADTPEELQTAVGLMKQSADLGHPRAMSVYGNMAMAGRGMFPDTMEAMRYWSDAALEYGDGECAFKLGMLCRDGIEGETDLAASLAWFMLARDLGLELASLDVDDVAFEICEEEREEAFEHYDSLRANCVTLK